MTHIRHDHSGPRLEYRCSRIQGSELCIARNHEVQAADPIEPSVDEEIALIAAPFQLNSHQRSGPNLRLVHSPPGRPLTGRAGHMIRTRRRRRSGPTPRLLCPIA